ncbi:E3 ubiquitin-protein ligase mib1 [Phytophthora pseudosyringae]|uniref:E3 ubiquitin-protein ligase mib1 n=1 Tax=Phytophthora pseudosyringae TaxID=221518 RepID=A0A8T1VSD6_9STRA|nr:E3 ubiquitin-protein ligase mib1 [Phytophthora pseudosyringae]
MPTSPAPRSAKKGAASPAAGSGPGAASPTRPGGKKKPQSSHIDQQLLELEHDDGKRHSKELTLCLNEYAKKIDDLQEKNRRLEEELSFDDHVARDDPFFNEQTAEKLSNLYLQGNNFMIRLELERKEVARLNALIQSHEAVLAQQKMKLYELAALDHNHAIMLGRVRKMEHDIDRRLVKMNEKLNRNRQLREAIDAHRTERARMDDIYTKTSTETLSKRHKVARGNDEVEKLRQEIEAIAHEIEDVRQEGEEWEMKCDRRAAVLLQELKEIALHQKDAEELVDVDKYKFLGENDIMKTVSEAKESEVQSRAKRSKWKSGQTKVTTDTTLTKYQENRTYIEKIHEVSGTKTVSEMIDAFNNQYPSPRVVACSEHFDRIQHVNQLAEEIENHRQVSTKLREEIGKLKQRKDSVDFQRMNRIEGLRSKLQYTNEQKKLKEDANREMQTFLEAIKPAVLLFHSRIGCSDVHSDDMKQVLGDIEEQIVTVLQAYHAKVEATKKEEAPIQTIASARSSSQAPPAKRKASMAVGARTRRSSMVPKTTPELISEAEAARTGSAAATSSSAGGASKATHQAPPPAAADGGNKSPTTKSVNAMLSKKQPYRYAGLRPPHLSMDELRKKDNVEEEYPLTYHELKVKVWHSDTSQ